MPGLPDFSAPQGHVTTAEAVIVTPLVPVAISLAVTKCPYRTQEPNCGCAGKWRCSRDEADVTFQQCVQCQQAQTNEAIS
jgi:hypothetical protein